MNACLDLDFDLINVDELFNKNGTVSSKHEIKKIMKKRINKSRKKEYNYREEAINEAIAYFVQKDKNTKFSKNLESRYVYNFDDLSIIIDTLDQKHLKHPVWFIPIPDFENAFEINFEILLEV